MDVARLSSFIMEARTLASIGSTLADHMSPGLKWPLAEMRTYHFCSALFAVVWWFIVKMSRDWLMWVLQLLGVQALRLAKSVRCYTPLMPTPHLVVLGFLWFGNIRCCSWVQQFCGYCDRARGTGSHSNPFEFDSSPLASGTDMTSRASIQRLVQLGMGSISAHFGTCHRC